MLQVQKALAALQVRTVEGAPAMAIVIVAGAVIGLVLASVRARGRGDWRPTPGQIAQSAGRFLLGSGGDGWGGPKPSSVWDKPRGDGWS